MQLEAGKKYVDRRGRVYGPMVKVGCTLFGEEKEQAFWYDDGSASGGSEAWDIDLIAEHVEVPDPEEWVDITESHPDHIPRPYIDWFCPVHSSTWTQQLSSMRRKSVGIEFVSLGMRHRCRRKHLPPVKTHETVELKLCVSKLKAVSSPFYAMLAGQDCPECYLPVRIEGGKFLVDVPIKDET